KAIIEGATREDFFGYADGVIDGRYVGLSIGRRPGAVHFDGEAVLVRREVALAQAQSAARQTETVMPGSDHPSGAVREGGPVGRGSEPSGALGGGAPSPHLLARPTRFYGSVKLNPLKAGSSAGVVGDEIVKHLAG